MDFLVEQFLVGVMLSMPSLGAFVVGMVLSFVFWQRAPTAAKWSFLGFASMFLTYLIQIAWHTVSPDFIAPESLEEFAGRFLLSLLEVPGYMCFLVAIFKGRISIQRYRSFDDETRRDDDHENHDSQPDPPRS
jgi:hypothetical protein